MNRDLDLLEVFSPCVLEDSAARHTEIVLADTPIVWVPTDRECELGYDFKGDLVSVRVHGLVAKRKP